jgi:Carboxypeptidase regulatory-like domain
MKNRLLWMVSIGVLFSSVLLFAQSDRGSINGTVTDPSGAVISNAKVTATDLATGEVHETRTNETGYFTFPQVKAGNYKVAAENEGFKQAILDNLAVGVQMTAHANLKLEVGSSTTAVTVESGNTQIQTENATIQSNVSEKQVRELPLQVGAETAGRTPLAFIFLDSSVTSVGQGGSGPSGRGTDSSTFKVNGGQALGSEILVDGASTRRNQNGTFFSEVAPSPNAFQEFTLSSGSYSSEFGASSGGVVNFTLKSGSNKLHGEAYEYFQNEWLNANSFFNNANKLKRNVDKQNDFGFDVGGPIEIPKLFHGQNKAFWFFNYEGYRFKLGETTFVDVPTQKMRNGDFSELLTDPYVTNFLGGPVHIYDPTQSPGTRTQIPNNDLSTYNGGALIDPAGQKILSVLPLPNVTGPMGSTVYHNYRAQSVAPTNMDQYVGKVDFVLSAKQHLSASYNYRSEDGIKGGFPRFPFPYVANGVWSQTFKTNMVRLQHDYTISTTLLNHLNLGFTRYDVANHNTTIPYDEAGQLGINAKAFQGVAFPRLDFPGYGDYVTSTDPRAYQAFGSTFFNDRIPDNNVELSDFVSWVHGKHTFKFGGDLRWQQLNVTQYIDPGGSINFRADQTASDGDPGGGWPIASVITGSSEFAFATIHSIQPQWRYFNQSYFANDDFKLTQKLTVNLGLRYELPGLRSEKHNYLRGFDPTVTNPDVGLKGAIVGAAGQDGLQAQYSTLVAPDRTEFAPRVGFAYALDDKSVVRGGYGIYYSPVLYGFNGANSITEGTLGYSTSALYTPNGKQSTTFLSNFPNAPAVDPNGQFIGSDVDYFNRDYKPGRTQQWSLDLQRELPWKMAVDLGYVGHHDTRLRSNFGRLNAIPLEDLKLGFPILNESLSAFQGSAADQAYAQSLGITVPTPFAGYSGSVAQALKPFPQYNHINNDLESHGMAVYHALNAKVTRAFSHGVQFGAAYTWSKLITNASESLFGGSPSDGILQNPYNVSSLRTLSPNDVTHVFVFNYLVELPFGKGKAYLNNSGWLDKVVGGWQFNGIHRYQSGLPLVVQSQGDDSGWLDKVGFGGNLRPNLTGAPILTSNGNGISYRAMNPGAFTPAPFFQSPPTTDSSNPAYAAYYANPNAFFGTAPTVLAGSRFTPFYTENLSVLKKTRITEQLTFEFGAEFFNAFNRHRYNLPDTDLHFAFDPKAATGYDLNRNFGNAGIINDPTVFGPRVIQLRGRVIF